MVAKIAQDGVQAADADWKFRQNAANFARQGYAIHGLLNSALLMRAADGDTTISEISGSVQALAKAVSERSGFAVAAAGRIGLTCQSCGDAFELPVDSHSVIHVARDAAELASWEDEAFESIGGDEKTSALELVEDELLLAIPYVPRCEKCDAAGDDGAPLSREFS